MTESLPISTTLSRSTTATPKTPARIAAEELEITFLSEMLKGTGLGAGAEGFDGGIGEEHFASFSRDNLARAMVQHGGLGLAEIFYLKMRERLDE